MINRQACSGTSRLSRPAFLEMVSTNKYEKFSLYETSITELEKQKTLELLEENNGNINKTASILGISASSLKRKISAWHTPIVEPNKESTNPTRNFYEKIPNPWGITSFDIDKKEVCIAIKTPHGINNLAHKVTGY